MVLVIGLSLSLVVVLLGVPIIQGGSDIVRLGRLDETVGIHIHGIRRVVGGRSSTVSPPSHIAHVHSYVGTAERIGSVIKVPIQLGPDEVDHVKGGQFVYGVAGKFDFYGVSLGCHR
jgi:hypothetical protein